MSTRFFAGVGIVALHFAGLLLLARNCQLPALTVQVIGPAADQRASMSGVVPARIRNRVTETWQSSGGIAQSLSAESPTMPGLARKTWEISRRGNQQETVAATQLVGPFQNPEAPPCSGRVVVGQQLLQDPKQPNSAANMLLQLARQNLRGLRLLGVGEFQDVGKLTLQWAKLSAHPEDKSLLGDAARTDDVGYLRAVMVIQFDRVAVPLVLAMMPTVVNGQMSVLVKANASLRFDNRALQWVSDKVGGNRIATMFARKEIDAVVLQILVPPPPVALPGGGTLSFAFCDQPVQVVENQFAALPIAVQINRVTAAPLLLPPLFPATEFPQQGPPQGLALDLDLNAINAILYECWRQGLLDRTIAASQLDQRFNQDPLVQEFLTVRISSLRLALPPVLSVARDSLHLGVESVLTIADPPTTTVGHAWASMQVALAPLAPRATQPSHSSSGAPLLPLVALQQLSLTCESAPGLLSSCYPLLSQAVAGRSADFNQALTSALGTTLQQLFVGNTMSMPGAPATVQVTEVGLSVQYSKVSSNAVIRLSLAASLMTP